MAIKKEKQTVTLFGDEAEDIFGEGAGSTWRDFRLRLVYQRFLIWSSLRPSKEPEIEA
jgi:hypothetical protein